MKKYKDLNLNTEISCFISFSAALNVEDETLCDLALILKYKIRHLKKIILNIVKPKSEVPKSKVPKSRPKGLGLTLKSHHF